MNKGLTLLEILIVITIFGILIGLSPLGLKFYKSYQLESSTQRVIQTLRRAELKATSVEEGSNFGVYFSNENFILFKGDSYASRDTSYDEVFDLPESITVGGLKQVVFLKYEGRPDLAGKIILNSNGKKRVVDINKMGRINLES